MQRPTPFIAPEVFQNADAALARVQAIYAQSLKHLREAMRRFVAGEEMVDKIRACYPCVRLHTTTDWQPPENLEAERLSFGFVATAGRYDLDRLLVLLGVVNDLFGVLLRLVDG